VPVAQAAIARDESADITDEDIAGVDIIDTSWPISHWLYAFALPAASLYRRSTIARCRFRYARAPVKSSTPALPVYLAMQTDDRRFD
jgi:hypothetical protein